MFTRALLDATFCLHVQEKKTLTSPLTSTRSAVK
jgi:hypothetical protein